MTRPSGSPDARTEPATRGGDGRGRRVGETALVPRNLAVAAAWSWRFLVLVAVAAVAFYALRAVQVVVLAVIAALLACTFLTPVAAFLRRRRFPRALAALTTLVGALAVLGGIFTVFGLQVRQNFDELTVNLAQGIEDVRTWIIDGPLGVGEDQLDRAFEQARDWVLSDEGLLGAGLAGFALTAIEVVVGALLALVLIFFFLKDGDRLWAAATNRLGRGAGAHADEGGRRAWWALGGYMRGQAIVAAVDALFIGLGVWLLGVPLALGIAVLTFFAGFFPIVGAVVAGTIAALVALATEGVVTALIVVGIVIVVQQIESNVLEPVVMARTVKMHPVVILVALGAGGAVGGLVGAFLAVPVAASVSAVSGYAWDRVGPPRRDAAATPAGAESAAARWTGTRGP